jgi:hypothetical protein
MSDTMMTVFVTLSCDVGYNDDSICTQHHMRRLQILSSLNLTSHDEVTKTVIIVPDITWQGYKYCHHCTQHHMTRLQTLSSLYLTARDKVKPCHVMLGTMMTVFVTLSRDVRYNDDSICNLVMWCQVTMITVFVTLSCDVGYNGNTVIIVPNITWRGYKYCHYCTWHHVTRLHILSSLYLTSHDKVKNTVIIVPNITLQWWQYL